MRPIAPRLTVSSFEKTPAPRARPAVDLDNPLGATAVAPSSFEPAAASPTLKLDPPDAAMQAITDARRTLAPRFTIVPDGTTSRRPNEVTAAEFENAVKLYADIAGGATQLRIDTVRIGMINPANAADLHPLSPVLAQRFREGALADVAAILQTSSGRLLLDRLAHAPQLTRITLDGDPIPVPNGFNLGNPGNEAQVEYLPGISGATADSLDVPPDAGEPWERINPSHVVLFHELTHALGTVTSTKAAGRVDNTNAAVPADVGIRLEEYRATGLGPFAQNEISENRYRAERAQVGSGDVGVLPQDEGMPQRTRYWPTLDENSRPLIRDPGYADWLVLSEPDTANPDPLRLALDFQNMRGMAVPDAVMAEAIDRHFPPELAAKVREAFALPQQELVAKMMAAQPR
jgi:hypothetical protein